MEVKMKTDSRKLIIGIFVLVGLGLLIVGIYKLKIDASSQLSDDKLLLTGKWQASVIYPDEMGAYEVRKTIEFVGPSKIIYNQFVLRNSRIQSIEFYNLVFHYQFVSESKIDLGARVSDKWTISKPTQNLIISGASFVGNGEYKRVVSVNWIFIAILLGFFVFWVFRRIYLTYTYNSRKQFRFNKNELFGTVLQLSQLVNILVNVLVFIGGAYLGTVAWSWWPILFIRPPWDGVILLEINLLILSYGLKLLMDRIMIVETPMLNFSKWQHYIGVFFGSLGFLGSVTSLLLIFVSIISREFLL